MNKKKTLIFSLIPVIILLLILEITGRIIYPFDPLARGLILAKRDPRLELSYLSENVDALTILTDLHRKVTRYIPFLGWIGVPNTEMTTIETNELGFRDKDIQPRQPNEFRILILGGSTAWGLGASSNQRTVAGELEARLNESSSSQTYRVFNAAYQGWTSREELIILTEFYEKFDPDMVISLTGFNDLSILAQNGNRDLLMGQESNMLAKAVTAQIRPMGTLSALKKVAGSLGIWRFVVYFRELKPFAARIPIKFRGEGTDKGIQKTVDRYIMMSDYATRHGASFFIALQPEIYTSKKNLTEEEGKVKQRFVYLLDAYPQYRAKLLKALINNDTVKHSVVDLGAAFDEFDKPVFIDSCHLNDTGYAQIANVLNRNIENRLH